MEHGGVRHRCALNALGKLVNDYSEILNDYFEILNDYFEILNDYFEILNDYFVQQGCLAPLCTQSMQR